jgi:hypothetical protein
MVIGISPWAAVVLLSQARCQATRLTASAGQAAQDAQRRRQDHHHADDPEPGRADAGLGNRGVLAELEDAGLVTLADKGYQGSTYAKIPYKGKNKPDSQKQANKAQAKLRAPGDRANAQLKTWKILTELRCFLWRAGQLARAIL